MGTLLYTISENERKTVDTRDGVVTYRELGSGTPLVLLHGIGSGSESWCSQLLGLAEFYHVIAWDAPGYGGSAPVTPSAPSAADYAGRLETFLDALGLTACHLVGHSLGAMMACRFAREKSERVKSLMLVSPAMGYGSQGEEIQTERRTGRIELLETLGPKGLARNRHSNLLSSTAPKWARERVEKVMSEIRPDGYRQAVELLVLNNIIVDAVEVLFPVSVVVGGADTVTPPETCKLIAESFPRSTFKILPDLGHACYVEGPEKFNISLQDHLDKYP